MRCKMKVTTKAESFKLINKTRGKKACLKINTDAKSFHSKFFIDPKGKLNSALFEM